MDQLLTPLLTSLSVALAATALVAVPGLALGWLLARRRFPGHALVDGLVQLPLVIPAVAVGYCLLWLLGETGLALAPAALFTRKAAVLAAAVMALPLVARMARLAFEGVDPRLERMARSLGLSPAATLLRVTLPLARRGLAGALVLGFARALGEFGATVVVAGLVPGETETLALAIFEDIQLGDERAALRLVLVAALLSFAAVALAGRLASGGPLDRGARR
ncbi:MAG: ABC transporter permease subunit [Planctomycetota bacterium]|nr:ABC transporter permease subunit [Planctomycetota bacterium]